MKKKCGLVLFLNCFILNAEFFKEPSDVRVFQVNEQQAETEIVVNQIIQTIRAVQAIGLRNNSDDSDQIFAGQEYITYFENPSFDPNYATADSE